MAKKKIEDPEINAMNEIANLMNPLSVNQQMRVMEWTKSRFPDFSKAEQSDIATELIEDKPIPQPTI